MSAWAPPAHEKLAANNAAFITRLIPAASRERKVGSIRENPRQLDPPAR
jgi:hypothetical protein